MKTFTLSWKIFITCIFSTKSPIYEHCLFPLKRLMDSLSALLPKKSDFSVILFLCKRWTNCAIKYAAKT